MNNTDKLQKLLPKDVILELDNDDMDTNFSPDEIAVMESWIEAYKNHYRKYGLDVTHPFILTIARVSKKHYLDFGLVNIPDDKKNHVIYICKKTKLK